jgi:predicted nucleic acid-binding protein
MNVTLLIDSIVRQTTVLIAQLATAAGLRAPLAHTANQVFVDLVKELKSQGLGHKVIADMFGLALRTYFAKVQRLSESVTFRGRSLWEAVIDWVAERDSVRQSEILKRFSGDDEASVRGVLADLVDSGLLYRTGRGATAVYRVADASEIAADVDPKERIANLVWLVVHRTGPVARDTIAEAIPVDAADLAAALEQLERGGRVRSIASGDTTSYLAETCVIPFGTSAGWEAAVFDHFQAMVSTIAAKLRLGQDQADLHDTIGGSTYGFTVWHGHPLEKDVLGLLRKMRSQASDLRSSVHAYNADHPPPHDAIGVIAYMGQTVQTTDEEEPS